MNKDLNSNKIIKSLVIVLGFTMAVAVKGGWIGKFWKGVPSWVDNHLPPLLTSSTVFLFSYDIEMAVRVFTATYILKLSMGEEAGAVINNTRNEYIDTPGLGREFGIKKAIQRGVMDGAAFSLAVWNPTMIVAGLFFVPVYWGMSKLKNKITGVNDWAWAEPIYGLIFGLFIAISLIM